MRPSAAAATLPPRDARAGVVPLTDEERATLRVQREEARADGGAWMEEALGGGGGLDALLEGLACGGSGSGGDGGGGGGSDPSAGGGAAAAEALC